MLRSCNTTLGLAFHHQDSIFVSQYCHPSINLTGNDSESLALAFHQQAATKMVIETEGNMGLIISAKTLNHVWTYYKAYFAHLLILEGPKITEV